MEKNASLPDILHSFYEITLPYLLIDHLCLEGWKHWNDYCYKFIREENSIRWTKAEENCKHLGGHLVSIENKDEDNFIHSLMIENRSPRLSNCYIGKGLLFIY